MSQGDCAGGYVDILRKKLLHPRNLCRYVVISRDMSATGEMCQTNTVMGFLH